MATEVDDLLAQRRTRYRKPPPESRFATPRRKLLLLRRSLASRLGTRARRDRVEGRFARGRDAPPEAE